MQRKIPLTWKQSLIRHQSLAVLLLASITSCSHGGPIPKWTGKLWAGDAKTAGITRAQEGQHIDATDPAFDNYLAMSYADFRSFYAVYVLGCAQWKPNVPMMTATQALERFHIVVEDLERMQSMEAIKP